MKKTLNAAAASPAAIGLALAGQKDDGGGGAPDEVLEAVKSLKTNLQKSHDQFKEDVEKLKTDFGSNTKEFADFKDSIDVKLTEHNGQMVTLGEKLEELMQKTARKGGGAPEGRKSVGEQVSEHEGIKDFRSGTINVNIEGGFATKAVTSLDASAGALIDPQRLPGIITPPDRRLTIRNVLAQGSTTSNAVEFVRETFTNNAAVQQNEGNQKAESDLSYDLDTAKVATIAHFIHVSKQAMDDAPGLASQIDNRLMYGYDFVEELQILKGDGLNGNLEGLVTAASAFVSPIAAANISNVTNIDVLRLAALQSTVAEYFASAFILNPVDWCGIELQKDTQGRYIFANPQGSASANMWGLPVVATNAMDADNFLTGALSQAAQIFDREEASVMVSTEDRDNFVKNMVTVLAEGRLALPVYRGDALITGVLSTSRAALNA